MHCMRTRYSVASNSADCPPRGRDKKTLWQKMVGSLAERRAKTPTRTISLFLRASAKGALSRESFLEEILPRGPGSGVLRDYLFIYYLRARKYLHIFGLFLSFWIYICTRPSPNMFDAAAK